MLRRPIHVRHASFSLRDIDLRVEPGEAVALLGANGSGKSTVLRLVAGIYQASAGVVETNGRITAVIELGAGFHPELTGAENIGLYAAVLGLTRKELAERYQEIVEFADMEDFLDTPLKYYSSGMEARLAFSVSVCLQPAILLLDEVLAVGDRAFRQRCLERLQAFHAAEGLFCSSLTSWSRSVSSAPAASGSRTGTSSWTVPSTGPDGVSCRPRDDRPVAPVRLMDLDLGGPAAAVEDAAGFAGDAGAGVVRRGAGRMGHAFRYSGGRCSAEAIAGALAPLRGTRAGGLVGPRPSAGRR